MRRSVSEILRRGFESVLANWPLLVIRVIESVVIVILVIGAIIAIVVPAVVSIGGGNLIRDTGGDPTQSIDALLAFIAANSLIILYVLGINLVVVTLAIAVHSFVTAGSVRVLVDSVQKTEALTTTTRDQMNAFTTERWMAGGRTRWWAVFWIYNIAWSVAFAILLIPFAIVIALAIALRGNAPVAILAGCLGILAAFVVLIPILIVTTLWTSKAIVDCVARGTAALDSLRAAWREFRLDFGRHLAIAAIMFVVSFGLAMVVGSFSTMASFGHQPNSLMLIPLQFSSSIFNSIVSAAVGLWFLACFSALAVERP